MVDEETIPAEVERASSIDWGVLVDGYLTNAAKVGSRFTATLFMDCARLIRNGETVVTPPVRKLSSRGDFCLVQSTSGQDHYVIVSEYEAMRLRSV